MKEMTRKIIIEVQTDSDNPLSVLRSDIVTELSCCHTNFELSNIKVTEKEEEETCP